MQSRNTETGASPALAALPKAPRDHRDRFLRVGEVSSMVSLGKTTIYKLVADGSFPAPCPIVGNRVAWLESEVLAWMHARAAARKP